MVEDDDFILKANAKASSKGKCDFCGSQSHRVTGCNKMKFLETSGQQYDLTTKNTNEELR